MKITLYTAVYLYIYYDNKKTSKVLNEKINVNIKKQNVYKILTMNSQYFQVLKPYYKCRLHQYIFLFFLLDLLKTKTIIKLYCFYVHL